MKTLKILLAAITTLWVMSCGSGDPTEDVSANTVPKEYREFDFTANQNTWYGFDKVSFNDTLFDGKSNANRPARNPDTRDSIYVSIAAGGTNEVDVVIPTMAGYAGFYITSSDPDVVSIDSGSNRLSVPENARTSITLTAGGGYDAGYRRAQVRLMGVSQSDEDSVVRLRTLYVEVFDRRAVIIHYYRAYDSRSFGTNVTFKPTRAVLETTLSEILRQVVVDVTLNVEELDIPYDDNGNGALDTWVDGVDNVELQTLRNVLRKKSVQEPIKSEIIVHIESVRGVWTIINPITRGTNVTLKIRNTTDVLKSWLSQNDIYIGSDERVTIKSGSVTDTSLVINQINNNYPANTLLWFQAGGVNFPKERIAFLKTLNHQNSTQQLRTFTSVMAHELSHGLFANELDDVNESGNVMHYQTAHKENYIFRMRPMQGTITTTYLSNGKSPQKQWLRLQKLEQQ